MSNQKVIEKTTEDLITFLACYTGLLEKQLVAVRETMASTVDQVMTGVNQIAVATDAKKKAAEATLDSSTYLNPDAETQVLVESVQQTVTELFDAISKEVHKGGDPASLPSLQPEVLVRNRLRRFSARFMNHVQALGQLDSELGALLLGMIGSLSADDVIAQRIDHVSNSLNAMQVGLNYFLLDFENRCRPHEIDVFAEDLKTYTNKQYTMQEEHEEFALVFPGSRGSKAQ